MFGHEYHWSIPINDGTLSAAFFILVTLGLLLWTLATEYLSHRDHRHDRTGYRRGYKDCEKGYPSEEQGE